MIPMMIPLGMHPGVFYFTPKVDRLLVTAISKTNRDQ